MNNVWGGYERMVDAGEFTWPKPFWEQPLWRWDAMFIAGVRADYHASQLSAPSMIARRRGLMVNISFWAAQKHLGNVAYGVAKAATDKMAADMAVELRPHAVTVVSLYPGLVRTEKVMEAAQWLDGPIRNRPSSLDGRLARSQRTRMCSATPGRLSWRRRAKEYGFTDTDGASPRPLTLADV